MDNNLAEHIDQQRWLMNNGLVTPATQDNLYAYGFFSHPQARNVLVTIDVKTRLVSYKIYLPVHILKLISKLEKYRKSNSIIDLFLARRLLKKEGNLDIKTILTKFVKDYCGPLWKIEVALFKESDYRDPEPSPDQPAH